MRDKFPKIHITIVNQPILNLYLNKFLKKHNIKYIEVLSSEIKLKKLKFDYVNFGSSLQYIKNYDHVLKILLNKNIKFFNISATSFFEDKSSFKMFIVKQVNLLPTVMYCYFFNLNYIKFLFDKYDYKIKQKKVNPFTKINFSNFNIKIKHLDILLKKS